MATVLPQGKQYFENSAGQPLAGGRLYTYLAGTSTPKPTFADQAGLVPNTNPIILDARGEALVYWSGAYKVELRDAANSLIWNVDNVFLDAGEFIFDGAPIADFFKSKNNVVIDSIAALRALDKTKFTRTFVTGYYTAGDGGGGAYWYDSSDTTSADNGGTIIVAADGGRWKLQQNGMVDVKQFGAKGDGANDDTAFLQSAITYCQVGAKRLTLSPGIYKTTATLNITAPILIQGYGGPSSANGCHIAPSGIGFDAIYINTVNYGVELIGFDIKPSSTTGTGGIGINMKDSQRVRITNVNLYGCYHGVLNNSSGDVTIHNMTIKPADVAGANRYGVKCTAVSGTGNPNLFRCKEVVVDQIGQTNIRTVDAFVHANGYNTFILDDCGALQTNHALWSIADGGTTPNYLNTVLFAADHCNFGVTLDVSAFMQMDETVITSSLGGANANISIGANAIGPAVINNIAVISTAGAGIYIVGGGKLAINGFDVSDITSGDGIYVNAPAGHQISLTGGVIKSTNANGLRIGSAFAGTLIFNGVTQESGARGLVIDAGAAGRIIGEITCRSNSVIDVDLSNAAAGHKFKTFPSVPFPFQPAPAVPATTVALTNTFGTDCMVYVAGGTVTAIAIDTVNTGLIAGSFRVNAGSTIAITYTAVPAWQWRRCY